MTIESYGMEERVITQLTKILEKNQLEEFDILPKLESQNRSPVIQEGNCLGLESWAVKSIFAYAYKLCQESKNRWKKEGWKRIPSQEVTNLEAYTRTALLLLPDVLTLWNCRKELIACGKISSPERDFQLTRLVVSRKPKCAEAFAHRRWLIKHFLQQSMTVNCQDCMRELALCSKAASQSPSNYHAWHHRQWSFDFLVSQENLGAMVFSELAFMDSWCETHVSDHSGLQYRQFLLLKSRKLSNPLDFAQSVVAYVRDSRIWNAERKDAISNCLTSSLALGLLVNELMYVEELMNAYEGHDALWQHKKFVVENMFYAEPDSHIITLCAFLLFQENQAICDWKAMLLQKEVAWLKTRTSQADGWCVQRYQIWMNKFLIFS